MPLAVVGLPAAGCLAVAGLPAERGLLDAGLGEGDEDDAGDRAGALSPSGGMPRTVPAPASPSGGTGRGGRRGGTGRGGRRFLSSSPDPLTATASARLRATPARQPAV